MEKHVLMYREAVMVEVYAMPSMTHVGHVAVGAKVYNPLMLGYFKLTECLLPVKDTSGIDFEFERTIDKCLNSGLAYWQEYAKCPMFEYQVTKMLQA